MNITYEADRLTLEVLDKNSAPMVLDFLSKNSDYFEPYESENAPNY